MSGSRTDETLRGHRTDMDAPLARGASLGSRIFASPEKLLFLLLLLSLPLVNPWVRGDGVGYFAYLRSALIHHNLDFEDDYLAGNMSFVKSRVDARGHLLPEMYTKTGHVENHFTVGPAILWAPVLATVHLAVVLLDHLGANIA